MTKRAFDKDTLVSCNYMNKNESQQPAERVLDAIVALKEKSEKPEKKDNGERGVDLVAIVKKLSKNRDKVRKANAKNSS